MRKTWTWLVMVSGVAMLFLGVWFLFHPAISLLTFTSFIGVLLMINGVFLIVNYIVNHTYTSAWVLIEGIVTTLIAVIILLNSQMTVLTLTAMFGIWVVFSGIVRIIAAFAVKKAELSNWVWILTFGIISTLFGFIMLSNPIIGMIGIVVAMGVFFIVQGINAISTFFFLRTIY